MNQTSQYIFSIYHYLLNLRDTMEYCIEREHSIEVYNQRKNVLTKGYLPGSALGNFLEQNKESGEKISTKLKEFLDDVYGENSTILMVAGDKVRVDAAQHVKIFDYVVGLSESIRDIVYGYVKYSKDQKQDEPIIGDLLVNDERMFRVVLNQLVLKDFEKSFGEFQKVMAESKGQPTPQSNFIVQNEIVKYAGFLRFSRAHAHCTDNDTLDLLDDVNRVIEMTEGRRDRPNDRPFNDLFAEINKRVSDRVAVLEAKWKEVFQKAFNEAVEAEKAAKENNAAKA